MIHIEIRPITVQNHGLKHHLFMLEEIEFIAQVNASTINWQVISQVDLDDIECAILASTPGKFSTHCNLGVVPLKLPVRCKVKRFRSQFTP